MKKTFTLAAIVLLAGLVCAGNASAWELSYECDVLPNSPTLGAMAWGLLPPGDLSLSTAAGGMFHLVDVWPDKRVYLSRESGISAGTPVTVETRVQVVSAASPGEWWWGCPGIGLSTYSYQPGTGTGGTAIIELFPDRVVTRYFGDTTDRIYFADMTEFHVLRIAMNASNQFWAWMDSMLIFSGPAYAEGQDGVFFGTSGYPKATADIYWDYVRYSKEFLPVPEPATLTALASLSLLTGAGLVRKRPTKRG